MLLPYLNKDLIEAGCDEAGRGCLAGAVYAAAVILPKDFKNELLNDSKQLTEHQRYALREVIEKEALAWAVGIVSPEEVRSFFPISQCRGPTGIPQIAQAGMNLITVRGPFFIKNRSGNQTGR